jgi:predicted acyl esterase
MYETISSPALQMKRATAVLALACSLLVFAATQQSQQTGNGNQSNAFVAFDRHEEMIRMRDGVRLHTLIFTPRNRSELLPFLLDRTPVRHR